MGRMVITVVAPSQKALSTSNPRGTRADDFYGKKRMRDPKMATEVTKRA